MALVHRVLLSLCPFVWVWAEAFAPPHNLQHFSAYFQAAIAKKGRESGALTTQYPVHICKSYVVVMEPTVFQKSPEVKLCHQKGVIQRVITPEAAVEAVDPS